MVAGVSILSGFLMSCNTSSLTDIALGRFQSLSGFLMSCNAVAGMGERADLVSIPIGFSNEL